MIRSMASTQVTATSSLDAIAAAADDAAGAILCTLNIPGRQRHSRRAPARDTGSEGSLRLVTCPVSQGTRWSHAEPDKRRTDQGYANPAVAAELQPGSVSALQVRQPARLTLGLRLQRDRVKLGRTERAARRLVRLEHLAPALRDRHRSGAGAPPGKKITARVPRRRF
jgi:hypothetical protein